MPKFDFRFLLFVAIFLFVVLYPKFPLATVSGSFVAIRLEDFVILLASLSLLFYLLWQKKLPDNTPLHNAIYLYLFIAICATFSGIILTKTASLSQGVLHLARRFEYMVLFFVGFEFFNLKNYLSGFIKVFLFTSLLVSLYGIGQQYFNFPIISTTNSEFSKGLALTLGTGARINSTFAGHYDLAAFMLFPLLLILALIPISQNKFSLIILWLLNYWVMLLSASRITFASLFVSALLLLYLLKQFKLIPLFIAISFFGFLASPQLRGRYLDLITNYFLVSKVHAQQESIRPVFATAEALQAPAVPEDRSLSIRLNAEWPKAIRAFLKNPLFGSGFSSIGLASDNEYLRILAESGVLGFAGFLLIILRYFKLIKNQINLKSHHLSSIFVISVGCGLLGLLINALFIDVFTASKIALTTWLLIGITAKIAT